MQRIWNTRVFNRSIRFLLIAIAIMIAAAVITCLLQPDVEKVTGEIDSAVPEQVKDAEGLKAVWAFVVQNGFKVPLQMLIFAFIPIQFLYFLNVITTAALPGILFGIAFQMNIHKGIGLLISALPHFLVEVFALCLLASVLFELNRVVRANPRSVFKKDDSRPSLGKTCIWTVKMYASFVLPIIIAAAFLETYIADIIFGLFD